MLCFLTEKSSYSLKHHFSSVAQSCPTLCSPMDCSTSGFPVHHQLLELAQIHVHRVSDAIQPSYPLSSPSLLPSIFPSIRVFSNELVLCIMWPKYWSFSFTISPSNEYSGLISFRMDWLDLLAGQGTLKSLHQHHNSKASVLQPSAFFMVQLSPVHAYRKNHNFDYTDLCWKSNVSAVQYTLYVCHSFFSMSKHLLISCLHSLPSVILEPKKIKPITVSIVSPSICHEVMGPDAMIFFFECLLISWLKWPSTVILEPKK